MAGLIRGSGVLAASGGLLAWLMVKSQLARERITVPASAAWLPGRRVGGPVSALAEAEAIRRIALEATGGKTYGELGEGDATAEMAMNASLLRSSLFTSVLAFGVAAAIAATGGVLIVIGSALGRLARRVEAGSNAHRA